MRSKTKNSMIRKFSFLVFIALSIISCKPDSNNQQVAGSNTKTVKKADLGKLYQYYHSNPTTLGQKEENTIIDYLANKNLSAIRTKSGVYIHTMEKGTGAQIKWGDPLTVDYKGYFMDGKEFDSSYGRDEPISFKVGNMNAGWNEGLPFLTKGTKATLLIPSQMGYGQKGFPGYVDPNTIILFDVDVKDQTQ